MICDSSSSCNNICCLCFTQCSSSCLINQLPYLELRIFLYRFLYITFSSLPRVFTLFSNHIPLSNFPKNSKLYFLSLFSITFPQYPVSLPLLTATSNRLVPGRAFCFEKGYLFITKILQSILV